MEFVAGNTYTLKEVSASDTYIYHYELLLNKKFKYAYTAGSFHTFALLNDIKDNNGIFLYSEGFAFSFSSDTLWEPDINGIQYECGKVYVLNDFGPYDHWASHSLIGKKFKCTYSGTITMAFFKSLEFFNDVITQDGYLGFTEGTHLSLSNLDISTPIEKREIQFKEGGSYKLIKSDKNYLIDKYFIYSGFSCGLGGSHISGKMNIYSFYISKEQSLGEILVTYDINQPFNFTDDDIFIEEEYKPRDPVFAPTNNTGNTFNIKASGITSMGVFSYEIPDKCFLKTSPEPKLKDSLYKIKKTIKLNQYN